MNDDFHIYTDISACPATENQKYLSDGFSGVCTGGTAEIEVFSERRKISVGDLVTVLPLQLVSIRNISPDFSMTFFKVDRVMFLDIMSSLGKITPDYFFYMRKNFLTTLKKEEVRRFLGLCRVIDYRQKNDYPLFRRETVLHLLRIYYWDFYVLFLRKTSGGKDIPLNSNKEKIAFRFAMLVFENYRTNRDVSFYAGKLCISPLYLTKVVQEVNGQSAREIIADYVIVEIKSLLRNADLEIKDVVGRTGFTDQSSFSRFFRKQTGMSPTEYRRTIHIIR